MSRVYWSDAELADLRVLPWPEFTIKYPYRTLIGWQQRRYKEGLHGNPGVDNDGMPGGHQPNVTPMSVSEPMPEHVDTVYTETLAAPTITNVVGVTAGEPRDIDEIRSRAEKQFDAIARRELRKAAQHLYFDGGPIALFFVGDQHIGAPGCNVRRLFHEQELITSTPGAFVVLTGDLVDNYVVSKLLGQNMNTRTTIDEDWALAREYVRKWGDRCVAYVAGNHTQWTARMVGLDIDRDVSPAGGLYDSDDLTFQVHLGPHEVRIRVRHKWDGSSIYSATHGQERAARFDSSDPDIYVGAHIHRGAMAREFVLNGKRKLAMLSSTYKQVDGFAAQVGFARNDASTAVALVINADGSYWGTGNIESVMHYMRAVYRGVA